MPHKYDQQLLDCVHKGPWKTPASALPTPTLTTPAPPPTSHTGERDDTKAEGSTDKQQRTTPNTKKAK